MILAKERAELLYKTLKKIEKKHKVKPSKFAKQVFKTIEDFLKCNLNAPCIKDRYNKFLDLLQNDYIKESVDENLL